MNGVVVPFSLKDAPALIERLLPVQELSAEAYKEQMANVGKTLTALGSYWKGRKPLILNRACILGCLLPSTDDSKKDLEIFEKLMGMDSQAFSVRSKRRLQPAEILAVVPVERISDYFLADPDALLPASSPIDLANPEYASQSIRWRPDVPEITRRELEGQALARVPYRQRVEKSYRPEEIPVLSHDGIWQEINQHLGTNAQSITELVEQLGIMRYGVRPRLADTFCGSGQIPFEAARLGCDTYAADLNPVASMLTWAAFNIVGGSPESRRLLEKQQQELVDWVQREVDALGIESDGKGWQAKTFLYCLEARCPQTGWLVPLIPSLVIGKVSKTVAELVPDRAHKRYDIRIISGVSKKRMALAEEGTVRSDGRGQDPYMIHTVDGIEYRTKISTLRGDYRDHQGKTSNRLRRWTKTDFSPGASDIFQERLYCIHWMRRRRRGKGFDHEFRAVTGHDLEREQTVHDQIRANLSQWQEKGLIPDMRIEPGEKTDEPIRTRGWTYWHHLFNPRQLLLMALAKKTMISKGLDARSWIFFAKALDWSSRISRWGSYWEKTENVFYNQALNTFYNYGARSWAFLSRTFLVDAASYPISGTSCEVGCENAAEVSGNYHLYVTDPPYGDAVSYEEILEYFISWLRKHPPKEFSGWIWDSRRSLAIRGQDEDFRRGMVAAYARMTQHMADDGIQVIMFTHQSGSIWADMANIVWASGLQVTAAWYVVTETDSALREGSYVKGTVLLVCRKRKGSLKTTRDDLAWEIKEEVDSQVHSLTGLNQQAKSRYRDENVFEDADIQMAGYAAALRVLTRYATIDGRDMTTEAIRPRVVGETTFVDTLIGFAVDTANQSLVPQGLAKVTWDKLSGADRFYLKMIDMEARGAKTLDNYQNFAKAFKVRDFRMFLASQQANAARLKSAMEFGRSEMSDGSEFHESVLRAVLYALMELAKNLDGSEVLAHLVLNIPDYYGDMSQRELAMDLAEYLAGRLQGFRPDEASNARVLKELLRNQRLG